MIDMHSHILYGIDDGAQTREISYNMLKIAQKQGIDTIIATPHFYSGIRKYCCQNRDRAFQLTENIIKKHRMKIKLLKGNEIFLDEPVLESIEKKECCSIADTDYILLEFPLFSLPFYADSLIYRIIEKGFKPIIAHPERYRYIQNGDISIDKYIKMGCYIQVNSTSVLGLLGKKAAKTAEMLIKGNSTHLIATDSHSDGMLAPKLSKVYRIIEKWIGVEPNHRLFFDNPNMLLINKEMHVVRSEKAYMSIVKRI